MSSLDELDARFGVGEQLRDTMKKRFGRDIAHFSYSVRWWPRRSAPTSAFLSAMDAWFIVGPKRVVEEKHGLLLQHAVEVMSPVPHDAALSLVDAFEFFQLGTVQRVKPSQLATDLAEVWHAPKVLEGRLVFFSFCGGEFRRISIDLETARVDDAPL